MKLSYIPVFLLSMISPTLAASRFPQPEFESDYSAPIEILPVPRNTFFEFLDVAVLTLTLALAAWLFLKRRSRRGIFLLSIFCLIYFGFWKKGCVCAVGSMQNLFLALSDSSYALPVTVLGFFLIPVIFTLFFGRVFCSSVCPLGTIQDLVILKPRKIHRAAEIILGFLPYIYLAAAVLLASTGASFIICRYDPFVSFFRLSGEPGILVFGACLLLTGIVVARPYCRFLCPYGVILGWASRFSRRHISITPSDCIQCRLCEDSCPFNAINRPEPDRATETRAQGRRRLGLIIIMLPAIVALGTVAGSMLGPALSGIHPTVVLADQIDAENRRTATETTLASDAFRAAGRPVKELYDDAMNIRRRTGRAATLLGAFLALVTVLKLMAYSVRRNRKDYEPDRTNCLSCARCQDYCPVDEKD